MYDQAKQPSVGDALGFLDSICISVFMSLYDIVGIFDRLADHDSL